MAKIFKINLAIFAAVFFFGCKKEFTSAPKKEIANSGSITIDTIVKRYITHYVANTPKSFYRFNTDVNLTCTVTADEISGNFYKTVVVEDGTGGIQLKLMNAYGLNIGDAIRINLNGVLLDDYADMVQLDSIDIDKRVVKISSGNPVNPVKVTFNQITSLNNNISAFQSRLVLLDSVEFSAGDKGQFYADTGNYKYSIDRTLLNSSGLPVIMRTSGFAKFAKNLTPCGKGQLVAVVGQYGSTIQLTLRDLNDVLLSNDNCPLIVKNFNDGSITGGGWTNYSVSGGINWVPASYNGRQYANISNYVGGSNILCATWLISPAMDLSNQPNPNFSFQSAYNYTGPALQVLVSTNYTSGNPNSATWTTLNPTLSPGSWNWTNSGSVSLNSYKSSNTRIAFRYTGTSSDGSTWEVDDIAIFGQ